jgi:hypothetical protein
MPAYRATRRCWWTDCPGADHQRKGLGNAVPFPNRIPRPLCAGRARLQRKPAHQHGAPAPKIRNPMLRMETLEIGRRTRTRVCVAYVEGIVNPDLVDGNAPAPAQHPNGQHSGRTAMSSSILKTRRFRFPNHGLYGKARRRGGPDSRRKGGRADRRRPRLS